MPTDQDDDMADRLRDNVKAAFEKHLAISRAAFDRATGKSMLMPTDSKDANVLVELVKSATTIVMTSEEEWRDDGKLCKAASQFLHDQFLIRILPRTTFKCEPTE